VLYGYITRHVVLYGYITRHVVLYGNMYGHNSCGDKCYVFCFCAPMLMLTNLTLLFDIY